MLTSTPLSLKLLEPVILWSIRCYVQVLVLVITGMEHGLLLPIPYVHPTIQTLHLGNATYDPKAHLIVTNKNQSTYFKTTGDASLSNGIFDLDAKCAKSGRCLYPEHED